MPDVDEAVPAFLKKEIQFANGQTYMLQRALNDYRSCHDGTPQEARIVFICTRVDDSSSKEDFIMKIKVQLPATNQAPHEGPSTTTAQELEALRIFRDAKASFAPQLIAYHCEQQDSECPLPGGFITYVVMTKLPGQCLFQRYWSMTQQQRDEILPKAVAALRSIYELGVEPIDRGLRNVMWDADTKQCGIVDFELWNPIQGTFANEKRELENWGLLRTPPAKDHFAAFQAMYR